MRDLGLLPFSGNFEPQVSAPFDARTVAKLKSDLVDPDNWRAKDGNIYLYPITVQVYGDVESNNGLYRLTNVDNYTQITAWEKVGSPIISMTYAEMMQAITSSALVASQSYILSDYKTTYVQPVTGLTKEADYGVDSRNVKIDYEPLIVQATDVDKISVVCRSFLHPEDTVFYSIKDNTEGFTRGKIYRRVDNVNNNDIGTDWRYVKYRRYALNVTTQWVEGKVELLGAVVVNNGSIYICNSTAGSWTTVIDNFVEFMFKNGAYAANSTEGITVLMGSMQVTIPASDSFKDLTMFNE